LRKILYKTSDIVNETLPKNKSPSGSKYKNETSGVEYEVLDNIPLTEWFMDNYKKFVSHLEIVTDKSSEGSQFVKGFGGIGGILRYKMENEFEDVDNNNEWNDDDFI